MAVSDDVNFPWILMAQVASHVASNGIIPILQMGKPRLTREGLAHSPTSISHCVSVKSLCDRVLESPLCGDRTDPVPTPRLQRSELPVQRPWGQD